MNKMTLVLLKRNRSTHARNHRNMVSFEKKKYSHALIRLLGNCQLHLPTPTTQKLLVFLLVKVGTYFLRLLGAFEC